MHKNLSVQNANMHEKAFRRKNQPPEPPGRKLFEVIARRFKPLKELGSGAVCRVDLAKDLQEGRLVAVKRLNGDMLAKPKARQTLALEAKALSLANHPGVPKLFHASLDAADPYLAESFVDGLAFSINNFRHRPRRKLLEAFIRICGMLSHLHGLGIVHRDVKPPNLILHRDLRGVSLTDYGFSLVPGLPDFALEAGTPVGTPDFMAPEQTYPKARVDRRADVYSLGVIMYAFTSGWYPYDVKSDAPEELMELHRHARAPLPHERDPSIHPGLSLVIARALEKEPGKRFQDAGELADALSQCLTIPVL
jgi:serine/threonine-protein kinase